jgi:acetyl esterase/lipase
MRFDNLPPQPPIHPPEAEAYARRALELSGDAADQCVCHLDVAYDRDYWQRVDVYRPLAPPAHPLPTLLFAHGGGWTNGYKEWMGLLAPAVTGFPALFVSVSHRLAPEHRFPRPFDDCVAALAWAYQNIDRYGGDPDRIFVGGHSSGGHLYALATLRRDVLRAAGVPVEAIRGCFPVSARFNLVFHNPAPGSLEHRHQSVLFTAGQDTVQASPFHQIDGNRVPFLLAWGSRDIPSIMENNEQMFGALQAQGTPVERLVLQGYDHFDTALETRHADNPWTSAVRAWMTGGAAP